MTYDNSSILLMKQVITTINSIPTSTPSPTIVLVIDEVTVMTLNYSDIF